MNDNSATSSAETESVDGLGSMSRSLVKTLYCSGVLHAYADGRDVQINTRFPSCHFKHGDPFYTMVPSYFSAQRKYRVQPDPVPHDFASAIEMVGRYGQGICSVDEKFVGDIVNVGQTSITIKTGDDIRNKHMRYNEPSLMKMVMQSTVKNGVGLSFSKNVIMRSFQDVMAHSHWVRRQAVTKLLDNGVIQAFADGQPVYYTGKYGEPGEPVETIELCDTNYSLNPPKPKLTMHVLFRLLAESRDMTIYKVDDDGDIISVGSVVNVATNRFHTTLGPTAKIDMFFYNDVPNRLFIITADDKRKYL